MNRVTRFVNRIDKALAPLAELASDENFRGEILQSAGAKEKSTPEEKAKTKEKLNFLLRALDALRKKLGLDKSDIPNVSNIIALGKMVAELIVILLALREVLKSCEYDGLDEKNPGDAAELETAINNAVGLISKFLAQNAIRKGNPSVAAFGEATGILSEEFSETRRALDLLLYPPMVGLKKITGWDFDTDALRPIGDLKPDDGLRITKGIFLALSIISIITEERLKSIGTLLFNLGYELDPAKDPFPHAANISGRVFQMQFIPGPVFSDDEDDPYPDRFRDPNSTDCILSIATIPKFSTGSLPGDEPLGYQYVLGLEFNPGEFGTDAGPVRFRFPKNLSGYLTWGHETPFHAFGNNILNSDEPLVELSWNNKAQSNGEPAPDVSNGDIFFRIHPKKKTVKGKEELDAEFSLVFHDFSYGLSGEGRDGFLQKLLPDNGAAKIKASFSLVYSPLLNKWTVEGLDKNDGILFLFRVGKTLFGKLDIPTLYAGLKPLTDSEKSLNGAELEISAMMRLMLGPFRMTVDRLGISLGLSFPKKSDGNLGFANLDLSLKPPTGIGFLVDAKAVKGGGFLSFDTESHQYYGAGELSIQLEKFKLLLKVVAIILTRMPDGSKGFSFLLLASVEFNPPANAPLGFKFKGVGVMVALNRSMNLEEFQLAVRDDRFNSILFPDNPVANAPTIVRALNSLFPPVEGRCVFALMARMGWGSTKLVDLKLGLLIEVPAPIKLALAGVLKVTIKEKHIQVLKLQVNFLVALDFGKQIFSVDAAIFESKFLVFDIKGEMFIRYRWGADSVFLVSVGGWHPDFQVPAGLNLPAKPQRLSIPLLESENPSLVLSCYVAFTPNTVQAGFLIDFKMKWSKFRLEASLGMDTLFHFEPFYFIVDFEGKLRIFWGSDRLAGVTVKGKFSGTNPWHIRGSATFEIWIWDYDVDFDKKSGEEVSEISQDVDVLPLIEKAIADKANWQTVFPSGHQSQVHLRNTKEDLDDADTAEVSEQMILADPLSRIEVRQQVAPLGIRIDKLGFQKVKGSRKFDLRAEVTNGQALQSLDVEDRFAPAMFIEMEDAEKLSRRSFEPMKSGRVFGEEEKVLCGAGRISPCDYDDEINDPLAPESEPAGGSVSNDQFARWIGNNSVARSEAGRQLTARREIRSRITDSKPDPFILADAITGTRITEAPGQKSMTEAYYELWKIHRKEPLRKIRVVRESEFVS